MSTDTRSILVWDLPTRLFHWLLASSFAIAWLTGDSERWREIHVTAGYAFAALIGFRLVWGLVGSRYARFGSFVTGPRPVARYLGSILRGRPEHHVGHNPAGGWAVLALLGLGLATAATGLLHYNHVGGHALEELHEGAASAMLGLVIVHIAAVVLSSLLHRENLVSSMVTGFKRGSAAQAIRRPHWIVGGLLVLALAGFVGTAIH